MGDTEQEVPSYAFLQSSCIEIKVSMKRDPIKLDSPLEAYACLGKLRKAFGLPCKANHERLRGDIGELRDILAGKDFPTDRHEKIAAILFAFAGDCKKETRHEEILNYAYETEHVK